LLPYAWSGSRSESRSVARVEPMPGRLRLSLVFSPTAWEDATSATTSITQAAITGQ